jgi:hypothetical protein
VVQLETSRLAADGSVRVGDCGSVAGLVNVHITMENLTIFHGKNMEKLTINIYKWPFSIAIC